MNEEGAVNEIIVKAGGEGGSIALYGLRSETGLLYSLGFMGPELSSGVIPPNRQKGISSHTRFNGTY